MFMQLPTHRSHTVSLSWKVLRTSKAINTGALWSIIDPHSSNFTKWFLRFRASKSFIVVQSRIGIPEGLQGRRWYNPGADLFIHYPSHARSSLMFLTATRKSLVIICFLGSCPVVVCQTLEGRDSVLTSCVSKAWIEQAAQTCSINACCCDSGSKPARNISGKQRGQRGRQAGFTSYKRNEPEQILDCRLF